MSDNQKTQNIDLILVMVDGLREQVATLQELQGKQFTTAQGFRERMEERTANTNKLLEELKEEFSGTTLKLKSDVLNVKAKIAEIDKQRATEEAEKKGAWKGFTAASMIGAVGGGGIVATIAKIWSQLKY
jgi:hypothetical protein